ncbi:hypothetical protein PIROE2DRAFT_7665 [Piromyces sp. E2]|nr:hypothetical protein PIROE2DRAFT_7665 [Piromyces sp. E2]|eukprot:OUM65364.1 hypothetical protein PIROE2DRAFT_7665 [Piromyces sp. E2]
MKLDDISDCYNILYGGVSNGDTAKYCGIDRLKRAIYDCYNYNNCLIIYNKHYGDTCFICKSVMKNENNSLSYMKSHLKKNNCKYDNGFSFPRCICKI